MHVEGHQQRSSAEQLAMLAEAYHQHQMREDPLLATYYGVDIGRDRLPDRSEQAAAGRAAVASDLADRVSSIDTGGLTRSEGTSRAMLLHLLGRDVRALEAGWEEFGIDAFSYGAQTRLLFMLSRIDLTSDGDGVTADPAATKDFITRLRQVPTFLRDAMGRHRNGLARGRTPVSRGVTAAIRQCRSVASAPVDASLILTPLRGAGVDPALRARGIETWQAETAPAFDAYAQALESDAAPAARDDDHVGLCWLDDGAELYQSALRHFTTLSTPDPDAIHRVGLDVVQQLEQEYAEIGSRFLGISDLAGITARLHADPELNYGGPDEIVAHAQALCDMAADRVGEVIGRLPSTPCVVKAIPEVEAHGAASAFYQEPASHRPYGTYWVNTIDPVLPRAEAEATAFHEAAPGHHTQLALQSELDLPTFRRFGSLLSGYAEGWGLYTERLADELGMYSGDLGRIGMLAGDSMRACRLVVDTGLHHLGWSRQRAIEYMTANSPLPPDSVRAEVDRYIVYPGQACSYMLGRLEIQRLRADAARRLGSRFELMGFHDVVLGEGSVPLTVLAENVDRWVADQGPAT